jgi:hypothetical protein
MTLFIFLFEEKESLTVLEGFLFLSVSNEHSVEAALFTWKRTPRFAFKTACNHLLFSDEMF